MSFFTVVLFALLQGVTEALPISRSGHGVVARLWIDGGAAGSFEAVLHLATALGLAVVVRGRLATVLGEGVRAVARPALFRASPAAHDAAVIAVAAAVSLVVSALTLPRVEMWRDSPTATGAGLIITGLCLASTRIAPGPAGPLRFRPRGPGPSIPGAVVVGMAHGLAVFPGASRVGAALTLLVWIGVKPARAVDLAFLLTIPALLVSFAHGLGGHGGLEPGTAVMGLVLAFVGAILASGALRALVDRRRVAALALWTIPLGLGMLAYAHALPRDVIPR
jgi:undecaprenyl-diphosphatase